MRSNSGKLTAEYVIVQFSIQTLYPFKMQCLLHCCCILLLWGSLEYGNPFPLHCGRKLCWSQTLYLWYKADSSVLNSPFPIIQSTLSKTDTFGTECPSYSRAPCERARKRSPTPKKIWSSIHPRNFGNRVTVRPSDRSSTPEAYQCKITQLTGMTPQATRGIFGRKSQGHADL